MVFFKNGSFVDSSFAKRFFILPSPKHQLQSHLLSITFPLLFVRPRPRGHVVHSASPPLAPARPRTEGRPPAPPPRWSGSQSASPQCSSTTTRSAGHTVHSRARKKSQEPAERPLPVSGMMDLSSWLVTKLTGLLLPGRFSTWNTLSLMATKNVYVRLKRMQHPPEKKFSGAASWKLPPASLQSRGPPPLRVCSIFPCATTSGAAGEKMLDLRSRIFGKM